MRILFLSTWYPHPPDNGSKLRVYHLLRDLSQQHEVTLISFAFATARPEEQEAARALCTEVQVVPVDPFAANRAGALHTFLSLRPVASRPIPAMREKVSAALASQRFDAVIASTGMMASYALQAGKGTARVLEGHNSMARWMRERYEGANGLLQHARCWVSWMKTRNYEARLFSRFDLVTMVSEQDRSASEALPGYRGRVEVVHNGVDCAHHHRDPMEPRLNALVYNGSLTYDANYDAMRWFLAEAYPILKAQIPGISLTITGSVRGVDLTGLALDDSVTLTGFVDDVRLPVAQAMICVAPIRRGGGTRLKILEAMALGTPVVATSKGAEGLEVIDGTHLLIADTPRAFAEKTIQLLQSPETRATLAANARALVETRYDWAGIGQRFAQLVEETVGRRRSGDTRQITTQSYD